MRAAIYARYSTELQREASIEDQVRICRRLISDRGWQVVEVYPDMGLSGSSHLRPSYQRLLEDARRGRFDIVVAESLDRISRDQEHMAAFHKQMSFLGIRTVTVGEGDISELHIGLKGTMSALYLKDLALKTHRGLEGRVRDGKAAGGLSYGYRLDRHPLPDGTFTTGDRRIDPEEAEVVRRIFRDFAGGLSPRAISIALNREGLPGPSGKAWGPSTIYGNWRRGTGVLNNELYAGRLVWNRQRFIKDPHTGKRQARINPPEDWIAQDVPELRIIDEEVWTAVKARQGAVRQATGLATGNQRPERARRPVYLFSGLLKCGDCGGGFVLIAKTRYGCANARNRGTCTNRRTIDRHKLEDRVLIGLKDRLLSPELIAEFVAEYQREYNLLRHEEVAGRAAAERELAQVERKIEEIIDAICEGIRHTSMKDRMTALEARKAELTALLAERPEEPLRLHPGLSEVYRAKVADLVSALNAEDTRPEATELLRGLLSEIRLIPEGDGLALELIGELAALLALGEAQKPNARALGTGVGEITLVAGAGFEPAAFRL